MNNYTRHAGYRTRAITQNSTPVNKKRNNDITDYLLQMASVRSLSIKLRNYLLEQIALAIKNQLFIEMSYYHESLIASTFNLLKKYDKKFQQRCKKFNTNMTHYDDIAYIGHKTFVFLRYINESHRPRVLEIYIFGADAKNAAIIFDKKTNNVNVDNMDLIIYNVAGNASSNGQYSTWNCVANCAPQRNFNTLYFDNNIEKEIIHHLDSWVNNVDIYKSRGLTYKTGILLHGKAGTGKTSIANAIAVHMNCNIINIDTATFDLIDINSVITSINNDDCRYVVLLDEIDAIFTSRDDENLTDSQKARTIKLLTFLDSVSSPSNVIFVGTTNYIDRLDAAIMRKGRFDKIIEVTDINSMETVNKMCHGFNVTDEQYDYIKSQITLPINPATLQTMILESMKVDL